MIINERLFILLSSIFGPTVLLRILGFLVGIPSEGKGSNLYTLLILFITVCAILFSVMYMSEFTKKGDSVDLSKFFKFKG